MANRRTQISMTDDEVRDYLEAQRILNVATIGPSGHVWRRFFESRSWAVLMGI